jgi:hypothetical protein
VSVTVPVGTRNGRHRLSARQCRPATVTVTLRVLVELMLVGLGVTVTVGVAEPVVAVQRIDHVGDIQRAEAGGES